MRPDERFVAESKAFWANVRSISQTAGYTVRGAGSVKVYSIPEMVEALSSSHPKTVHFSLEPRRRGACLPGSGAHSGGRRPGAALRLRQGQPHPQFQGTRLPRRALPALWLSQRSRCRASVSRLAATTPLQT